MTARQTSGSRIWVALLFSLTLGPAIFAAIALIVFAALAAACTPKVDPAIANTAAQKATENAREGAASVERLATGLVEVTGKGARMLGPFFSAPVDPARVRNIVRVDMHDDHSEVGRDLTMYPTWFLAAVGTDGRGVAGDRDPVSYTHLTLPTSDLV